MTDANLLNVVLRQDLSSFIARSFMTLDPGTPYLPNWHIDAIAWQLMRVWRAVQARDSSMCRRARPNRSASRSAITAWVMAMIRASGSWRSALPMSCR